MADVVAVSGDGDGDEPDELRQDTRGFFEIMEPEGSRGSWGDLPRLLVDTFRLVWRKRRELLEGRSVVLDARCLSR